MPDLPGTTPNDALAALHRNPALTALHHGAQHLERMGLLEDIDIARHTADLARLEQALAPHPRASVADLTSLAGPAIAALVGVRQLHTFAAPPITGECNRLRNTLLAAISAYALQLGAPMGPVVTAAPAVMPRSTGDRRAEDDEIVLLRLMTVHLTAVDGSFDQRALTYVLVEAGARTGETTAVAVDCLDDPRSPSCVTLPGGHNLNARTVPLPAWAAGAVESALGRLLAGYHDVPPQTRLTYKGAKGPGSNAASASACTMLNNHIAAAGIAPATLKPLGIARWRVNHLREHVGEREARHVYGGKNADRALGFAHHIDDATPETPEVIDLLAHLPMVHTQIKETD